MKYQLWKHLLAGIIGLASVGSSGASQTLFQRPDTIPNYSAYKYTDQCLAAVRRTVYHIGIKDTIWYDTASYDPLRNAKPIPAEAIRLGRLCLSRMSVDSVPVKEYDIFIPVLLLANRDDDVNRIVHNTLDTIASSVKNSLFSMVIQAYSRAIPRRLNLLEKLLARDDSPYKITAAEGGDMLAEVLLATTALDLGQSQYAITVVTEILKKDGKYASKLPKIDAKSMKSQVYPLVIEVLTDQAMDSLAVSTLAYRQFLENLWNRLSSRPFLERNEDLAYIDGTLPPIKGDFWYTNLSEEKSAKGSTLIDNVKKTSEKDRPVKGKVNAIVFFQGGCHIQSESVRHGRYNGTGGTGCWRIAAMVNRLKKKFPELEVTIVSKTFGSIGSAPPLTPQDEADTLAEYFLNFYKIPGVHVIAKTDFVRMPGYDRRRLDLEVSYETDLIVNGTSLGHRDSFLLVDEIGHVFHSNNSSPSKILEPLLEKKLAAVMKRLSNVHNDDANE